MTPGKQSVKKNPLNESSPNYFIYSEDELVDSNDETSMEKEGGEDDYEGRVSPEPKAEKKFDRHTTTQKSGNYSMTMMGGIMP